MKRDDPVANRDSNGRFGKGNSANPGGRPKGKSFPTLLRETLPPEDFARQLSYHVRRGEPWAVQLVAERYWPKTLRVEGEIETRQVEGPYLAPFASSQDIEDAVVTVPEGEEVH